MDHRLISDLKRLAGCGDVEAARLAGCGDVEASIRNIVWAKRLESCINLLKAKYPHAARTVENLPMPMYRKEITAWLLTFADALENKSAFSNPCYQI